MYTTGNVSKALLFLVVFLAGSFTVVEAGSIRTINLPDASGVVLEDDEPEVVARVGRVSFISGAARIRRADIDDWENVTLNLPIVEGDEIVTDPGARIELQLAKDQHLRLSENSFLKIVELKDEGVAVSLSLGTMYLNVITFDKERTFFEIDAPKTTIAIQSAGAYRIDAGAENTSEVSIAAMRTGEARIYSDNAGFTIKAGRSARLFIDGPRAGEWETGDAMASLDQFDRWSLDRDEMIAGRLKDAYYDQYYDNDIYGADDLNDNGQWLHTRDYGYVWRPSQSAIGRYADWSPYRYGHWRWLPAFGWTWVNDEPWGWATYHYGRWFYHDGYWNWSPYGYYRSSRSWWRPALVVITIVRNNICWYPLRYHQAHYNYNRHRDRRPPRGGGDNRGGGPIVPERGRETAGIMGRVKGGGRVPTDRIPPTGVVGVDAKDFGTGVRGIRRMPKEIADTALDPRTVERLPELPKRESLGRGMGREILAERPRGDLSGVQARVGAAKRSPNAPLDGELRNTRVFGGRPPVREATTNDTERRQPRPTGIFERPAQPRSTPPLGDGPPKTIGTDRTPSSKDSPRLQPPVEGEVNRRVRPQPKDSPNEGEANRRVPPQKEPPTDGEVNRRIRPQPKESPRYDPPAPTENPRRLPPQPKESPRKDPPAEREKPRNTTPPVKETPKSDPPKAKDPPKSERPASPARKADPIT